MREMHNYLQTQTYHIMKPSNLISPTHMFKWRVSFPKIFGMGSDYQQRITKSTYKMHLLRRYQQISSKSYK